MGARPGCILEAHCEVTGLASAAQDRPASAALRRNEPEKWPPPLPLRVL